MECLKKNRGRSHIAFPYCIKKATINLKHNDDKCFQHENKHENIKTLEKTQVM